MLLHQILQFEPGCAHRNTECLGFIGSGDSAAIIIAQHDDRLAVELGIEDAFAGDVEVVDVDQSDRTASVQIVAASRIVSAAH